MYLNENDEEIWRSWSTEPVRSIEEAMREVTGDGTCVFFHPIAIHPEYRTVTSKLVRAAVAKLPAERRQIGKHRLAEWQMLCERERDE